MSKKQYCCFFEDFWRGNPQHKMSHLREQVVRWDGFIWMLLLHSQGS